MVTGTEDEITDKVADKTTAKQIYNLQKEKNASENILTTSGIILGIVIILGMIIFLIVRKKSVKN